MFMNAIRGKRRKYICAQFLRILRCLSDSLAAYLWKKKNCKYVYSEDTTRVKPNETGVKHIRPWKARYAHVDNYSEFFKQITEINRIGTSNVKRQQYHYVRYNNEKIYMIATVNKGSHRTRDQPVALRFPLLFAFGSAPKFVLKIMLNSPSVTNSLIELTVEICKYKLFKFQRRVPSTYAFTCLNLNDWIILD